MLVCQISQADEDISAVSWQCLTFSDRVGQFHCGGSAHHAYALVSAAVFSWSSEGASALSGSCKKPASSSSDTGFLTPSSHSVDALLILHIADVRYRTMVSCLGSNAQNKPSVTCSRKTQTCNLAGLSGTTGNQAAVLAYMHDAACHTFQHCSQTYVLHD